MLHSFEGGFEGEVPDSALVVGTDGVLYGTTGGGGTTNDGTVFALNP